MFTASLRWPFFLRLLPIFLRDTSDLYYGIVGPSAPVSEGCVSPSRVSVLGFFLPRGYFYQSSLEREEKSRNKITPGWNLPAPGCYQEEIMLFICEKQEWKEPGDGHPGCVLSWSCHCTGRSGWESQVLGRSHMGQNPYQTCLQWEPNGDLLFTLTRWPCNIELLDRRNFCCTWPCITWECQSAAISPVKRLRVESSLMTSNCFRKTKAILRWVELSYTKVKLFRAQKWITNPVRQ